MGRRQGSVGPGWGCNTKVVVTAQKLMRALLLVLQQEQESAEVLRSAIQALFSG